MFDRLHRETLDDQRVEAVEGAEYALDDGPTLGCVGIDIGKGGKIVGQSRSAVHRNGRPGGAICRLGGGMRHDSQKPERAVQRGLHSTAGIGSSQGFHRRHQGLGGALRAIR